MKRPTQSVIEEAQHWVDERVEMNKESLTKKGFAKAALNVNAFTALKIYEEPELLTKFVNDGNKHEIGTMITLWELAALYLESGQLPPDLACKHAAELLRKIIKGIPYRGSLTFRDGEIVIMLLEIERRGIPLFPNPDPNPNASRSGQTYGCDIVIKAFKKVGIHISRPTVEKVWKTWSRLPQVRDFRTTRRRDFF
jgi:hypothetical protein